MGFIAGLISYSIQLGYSVVKAFVFWIAFNYFAPIFSEQVLHLPITHITYWFALSFFFVLTILSDVVGSFLKSLIPTLIKVEHKTVVENKKT